MFSNGGGVPALAGGRAAPKATGMRCDVAHLLSEGTNTTKDAAHCRRVGGAISPANFFGRLLIDHLDAESTAQLTRFHFPSIFIRNHDGERFAERAFFSRPRRPYLIGVIG